MENNTDHTPEMNRREAIAGGLAAFATMLIAMNPFKSSKEKETGTIKMLDENGKLIEVSASALVNKKKKKITDLELQKWIKK